MFSERWNQDINKEVPLEDTDPKIFRKFLEFMYSDAFVANVTEALELLQVAHKYDVQLLVSKCEKLLESEVTLDDAVDVFQAARKYDKTQLMDKVGDLMAKSLRKLQSLASFSRVDKQTLIYILKRNDLKMKEVDLFRLAVQWAKNQSDLTAQQILQDIMTQIHEFDGKNTTSFGLNGITIYCPSRVNSLVSATVPGSFKKFKIIVRADFQNGGYAVASKNFKEFLNMPSVEVEEGKITDIKFDNVVQLENESTYCISAEEMKPGTSALMNSYSYEQQSYNTKCFGNHLSTTTVQADGKTVSLQIAQRNHLQEFRHNCYNVPQLILKFSLEEL